MNLISRNPVTHEEVFNGACATSEQIDAIVAAARRAFRSWSRRPLEERIDILRRYARELEAAREPFARLIGRETGKPLWDARLEVGAMIGKIGISIDAYQDRTGFKSADAPDQRVVLRHRPHGVLAVLGPFNFPGHLPNGHIVPALLAGNAVVFKPSEHAPAVATEMFRLWRAAGLPQDVLQVVIGGAAAGAALAQHAGIDGLCFTGSSRTGHQLHQAFATQPHKILALEMGGNNPLVIEEGIDEAGALHHILLSAYVTAGQRCTCARRLLAPRGAWGDRLVERLAVAVRELRVGAWDADPQPFMGAVISAQAAQQVLAAQQKLLDRGAVPLVTCRELAPASGLLSPGLIDVSPIADPADEEVFGPLLQIQRYRDFEHALELANATRYGLAAGLLSPHADHWREFTHSIRAGVVNWNRPLTGASSALPFGGVGASGNHRPSAAYAADYCAYPMASLEADTIAAPANLPPGMSI